MAKKHLYISLSAHGFGHIGQMAPILNKLAFEYGNQIQFTIQCQVAAEFLKSAFLFDFKHIQKSADIGMIMANSLDVQAQQTHRAYKELHRNWSKEVQLKAREIDRVHCDLVVSNVSYLTLAAANQLNLPSIGLCSLNWADIYYHYCRGLPGADEIHQAAVQHYQGADRFLIPAPGMPMEYLPNRMPIGPLARLANRYPNFKQRLHLPESSKLVMVSMGGIPHKVDNRLWPKMDGVVWLDAAHGESHRPDVIPIKERGESFIDVLGHCDLLVTKPGYGLFTESTCNGIPTLYVKRNEWPEEPYLLAWLEQYNPVSEPLNRDAFHSGDFAEPVAAMLTKLASHKAMVPCAPTGVGQACGAILEALEIQHIVTH